eukprot:1661049-Amphidinium_carterae.2
MKLAGPKVFRRHLLRRNEVCKARFNAKAGRNDRTGPSAHGYEPRGNPNLCGGGCDTTAHR